MRLTINDIPEAFKKELETTIDKYDYFAYGYAIRKY